MLIAAGRMLMAAGRMLIAARKLVVGIHDSDDAAVAWDAVPLFLGAAWEKAEYFPHLRHLSHDHGEFQSRCLRESP